MQKEGVLETCSDPSASPSRAHLIPAIMLIRIDDMMITQSKGGQMPGMG